MRLGLLLLLLPLATPAERSAHPNESLVWYFEGHRLVARIAALRLTPQTQAAVKDLLGGESLVEASVWADNIKIERPDTKPLHYVNIPLNATDYVPSRDCPDSRCLIAAIEEYRRILSLPTDLSDLSALSALSAQKTEALRFLIHFIGDLHQPLHVSNNRDEGGNNRMVTFFGTPRKLHEVWDGELIEESGLNEDQYFDRLRRKMDSLDLSAIERGTIVDWAMEGHRLAAEHAYQLPRSGKIGEAYEQANLPLVDLALIEAGVRLAKVLNEALGNYHAAPAAQPSAASAPGTYPDREAAAHVGEVATVVGTVVAVHRSNSGNIYLNFGANYPNQTFSAAILNPRDPKLLNLDSLTGKRVSVKGLIKLYKGKAEIVVESAGQIEVRE
ncbi:MAG TPA: S1/P1 nuclease [Gemmatimonadales bacterium]|nr:S1/P1 nuclease [Gemmatimonadales bacterium]